MIELTRHPMKIAHLNLRSEMHGDSEVSCMDIKLEFDLPNTALDGFATGLRASFYAAPNDPDMLGPDAEHLTHVKRPQLGLKWDGELSGVGLHMHAGNGKAKGDLIFPDAVFGKLSVSMREGGTCACVSRARVKPSTDEAAKLFGLLKHSVPVSLDLSSATGTDDDEE
jgi:hypothetical protein